MKNAVFYKCCIISVHVSTPPEKHLQKPSKIDPKSYKIDPITPLKHSFEAKRAEEERKSAQDDPRSAPEATFATHPARFGVSKRGITGSSAPSSVRAGATEGGRGEDKSSPGLGIRIITSLLVTCWGIYTL